MRHALRPFCLATWPRYRALIALPLRAVVPIEHPEQPRLLAGKTKNTTAKLRLEHMIA
jgi:hypothetical protein